MAAYPNITDISTVLNAVCAQATGASLASLKTADFTSVAQTTLKAGYDRVIESISQVLSKTIFSSRRYSRHFKGLEADAIKYGNHVRKLQVIDGEFEPDGWLPLTDGQSVDQYVIKKPNVVQTNFYDQYTYEDSCTFFRRQLDVAFSNAGEFAQFVAMVMENITNRLEQADESLCRGALLNYMAAIAYTAPSRVIHLVTEYKTYAGITDQDWNVYSPDNYIAFVKWMTGRIKTLCGYLTERTSLYHNNITGKTIMRHTPYDRQKIYLLSSIENNISSSVLSDIYNDELLKMADHELVNFWQTPASPSSINVQPKYMAADGTEATTESTVNLGDVVIGVIFDDEAVGYTVIEDWMASTPLNIKGEYYNTFWKRNYRYWNDLTENGLLLAMD